MPYFGLRSSLFIMVATITITYWHRNTPDVPNEHYAPAKPNDTTEAVSKASLKSHVFLSNVMHVKSVPPQSKTY